MQSMSSEKWDSSAGMMLIQQPMFYFPTMPQISSETNVKPATRPTNLGFRPHIKNIVHYDRKE